MVKFYATLILFSVLKTIVCHTTVSSLSTRYQTMHSMGANSSSSELSRYITGVFLYSLTIWTIIGNIFVCIAIATNRQLKQGGMSNFLIGNLALSDLLLGLTVLPFSATLSTFKEWLFGKVLCDLWLSIDVLCSTASIWGLVVISLDRYVATNHPIRYRKHKNNFKMALLYCTISWFISITISLGPLTVDPQQSGLKKMDNSSNLYQCVLFQTPSFVIVSSVFSFYLPLVLMMILYAGVFLKIRQQSNLLFKSNHQNGHESIRKRPTGHSHHHVSEAKVTKTLAIIMGVFVACWLPFFIIYIIRSQLADPNSISENFMDVFIWLGYLNSSLNPILYAVLNKNFRIAFSDIVVCRCFNKTRNFLNKSFNKPKSKKSKKQSLHKEIMMEKNKNECLIDHLGS